MAKEITNKALVKGTLLNTDLQTLYIVPANAQATILSSIRVTNVSSSADEIYLYLVPEGENAVNKNAIAYRVPVDGNSVWTDMSAITLEPNMTLQAKSYRNGYSAIYVSGIEIEII